MKNALNRTTSQDYDRKHGHDHIIQNPRAAKDVPGSKDSTAAAISEETAEIISKGHAMTAKASESVLTEDKRSVIRHEHTNHFSNRASVGKK